MGININDLDNNLNYSGESKLSGDENNLDNLRELSSKELQIFGGAGSIVYPSIFFPIPSPSTFVPVGSGRLDSGSFNVPEINININITNTDTNTNTNTNEVSATANNNLDNSFDNDFDNDFDISKY